MNGEQNIKIKFIEMLLKSIEVYLVKIMHTDSSINQGKLKYLSIEKRIDFRFFFYSVYFYQTWDC